MPGGHRLRRLPRTGVGDGDVDPLGDDDRVQVHGALRMVAVSVLDRVGQRLSHRDQHIERFVGARAGLVEPVAQGVSALRELPHVGPELQIQRGGLSVDEYRDVVAVPAWRRQRRHQPVGQSVQRVATML